MKKGSSFSEIFFLPLVMGGELQVGHPRDSDDLAALKTEVALASPQVLEIEAARQAHAAELSLYPIATPLDQYALQLCLGIHNLLFLSHPSARQQPFSRSAWRRMEAFTSRILEIPPAKSAEETIARHTLTHNLLSFHRSDVDLECWVASYSFKGMTPPPRLLRWKRLRRIQEHRRSIRWPEQETLTDLQLFWLKQILGASPLTDLLHPLRSTPPFIWLEVAEALRWPEISRLVAHQYLELGLHQAGPALAQSFWELVQAGPSTRWNRAIRMTAGLMFHLYATTNFFGEPEVVVPAQDPPSELLITLATCQACGLEPPASALLPAMAGQLSHMLKNVRVHPDTAQLRAGLESVNR